MSGKDGFSAETRERRGAAGGRRICAFAVVRIWERAGQGLRRYGLSDHRLKSVSDTENALKRVEDFAATLVALARSWQIGKISRRLRSTPSWVLAPALLGASAPLLMRSGLWQLPSPETHVLTRWVFLRLLGATYLCAFASYSPQLLGLIGRKGIMPAADFLDAVRERYGREGYWYVPTLAWLDVSDRSLRLICGSGIGLSLLLIADVAPVPVLIGLWICYQSLSSVSQEFLGYQWDALLLETGFLAIFYAPPRLWPDLRREAPPPLLIVWLLRLLCFRLMFFSGLVKLASRDVSWRGLSAMSYHYQTQPLPTPLAWYAHQLPRWVHVLEAAMVFAIELGAPLLIWGPRPARLFGATLLSILMLLIMLTGNYAFFNWLSAFLCIPLLDDDVLLRALPACLQARLGAAEFRHAPPIQRIVAVPVGALILSLNVLQFVDLLALRERVPPRVRSLANRLAPLHIVNRYGLFAVMTTTRPEIVIEGSNDGRSWQAYEFRHKPGDVHRRPTWVAPHQPRLDWQMWFAALTGPWQARWFTNFLLRLLENERDVLKLLRANPFPDAPPRYVRAMLYDYRFTRRGTPEAARAWWECDARALYYPPVSLRNE